MKKIKPLKKKHKGLKIFLIVLCVILVLPIAFIFGAFYDPTTKNVSDADVHYQNIVAEGFYKGISELSKLVEKGEEPIIGFKIDEEMIDGIMMAACDKINQKQWIPKMYCYINDNNYTFVMDAQASFFKTRALIHTSLDKEEGDTLVFKITGVTLGRLPLPLNWITGLLGNFINDDVLNKAFEQSGFRIQSHLNEAKLTYSRTQFKEDVGGYVSKLGENNPYLNVLLSAFDNDGVLFTDYEDGVYVGINLIQLATIPDAIRKDAPINFVGLEEHRKEVVKLMNMGEDIESGAPKIFTYLLRGKNSSNEIKEYVESASDPIKNDLLAYVKTVDPSATGLDSYKGSKINNGSTYFTDYCGTGSLGLDDVIDYDKSATIPTYVKFMIPSNDLNSVLAYKLENIIGATIPVTFKENDVWDFQYITIDNVYTGFKEDTSGDNHRFNIYIRLNIGGVPVTLVITADNIGFELATEQDNKLGHLKFQVKDINFGSINIPSIKGSLAELIPSSGVFSYNKEKGQFEVSIDELTNVESALISIIRSLLNKPHELDKDVVNDTFSLKYNLQQP